MKLNVFGRMDIEVIRRGDAWLCFYLGSEGKKRLAPDIHIPSSISGEQLIGYLEDLLHEWATPQNHKIERLP